MKNATKMKSLLARRVGIYREKPKVNYGYIGNQSTGEVSVPGTKRTIYVTSIDGVVFKVVCKRVEPNFQTKVIFGNDPDDMPGVTQVLSEWNVYGGPGIIQGSEDNGIEGASYIGSDPTNSQWPSPSAPYIEPEQIQISNYYPSGLTVDVYAGVYLTTTGVKQIRIVTTIDHTASVPTTADMCRYSLLVVDASGAFVIRDGAEVTGFDNLVTGDIAAFVAGDNPIYAVALFTGQTELRRDGEVNHFVDLRFMGVSSGSAVTTGPHASTHISTGTDPIDDAVAAGASGLMSGVDKTKLDGIAAGAEVNVNADWNAASGDAVIFNKPTLPSAPLRIRTVDSATNVTPVETIVVTNGTLTDDTGGQVTIDTGGGSGGLGLDPIDCTAQVDGTETHFTFTPASTAALALLNGALMKPADVTLDGDGLGVVLGFPPEVGDNLIIIRAADVVESGGHTIQDAGTPMTARSSLNFIGMTVEDDAVNAATKVTAKPGHVVQNAGTSQTQRSKLNFIGATVADNSGSDSTDVTVSSVPSWVKNNPANIPASPSATDDEFDATLTGWTTLGSPTTLDSNTIKGHLHIAIASPGVFQVHGCYKSVPSIPFTVTAKLSDYRSDANYQHHGLMLTDGTPTKLFTWGPIYQSSNGTPEMFACNWNSRTSRGSFTEYPGTRHLPEYIRMVVNSNTSIDLWYSLRGYVWVLVASAWNPGFSVSNIGFAVTGNDGSVACDMAADFIRFE